MRNLTLSTLLASLLVAATVHATELNDASVPAPKQTSLGLYINATDAYHKWKADPTNIKMIDVRTLDEFRTIGYPKMAAKIPLSESSEEFVNLVKQVADTDDTVLVICRSGNRSAVAVNMLAQAGYKNAYTVVDGFEGDRNSDSASPDYGKRTVNGWKNAGLPWVKP